MQVESLAGDVLAQAQRRPQALALLWRDRTVSYRELAELAERARIELDKHVPSASGPVALHATKSPESIAVILACLSAGRPLLLASPELGRQVLDSLVERAGCLGVVTAGETGLHWRPTAPPAAAPLPPAGTCLLLTTSGSTGLPKIVPLGADAVHRFTGWAGTAFGIVPDTRVLNYAPLNFDLCLLDVWATLRHGGCAVLVDPEQAVNPRYLLKLFRETEPQVVQAVPMLFRILAGAAAGEQFPGVTQVLLTGDHTPQRLRAELPGLFPHALFHNVYGCTETNDSFLYSFTGAQAADRDVLPLGGPIPGVAAAVLADGAVLDGPGLGELIVSTPFQADGYLLGDERGERFFRRPSGSGERTWYRTGDLVRRDTGGELTLVGRNDFQVKVRGVRVSLEEIERVIHSHEDVLEAAVVALPDADAGMRLHAVVRTGSAQLNSLRLHTHCAARLTRAAIPSTFRLVDEPLPTGATGKVDRSRIREDLVKEPA